MKKISKVLSFIIGSAMAIGTMSSLSANAVYMESSNIPLTPPDGEELYEFDCENGIVSYRNAWHERHARRCAKLLMQGDFTLALNRTAAYKAV